MHPRVARWKEKGKWHFEPAPYDLDKPCVIWTGAIASGYAYATIDGKNINITRWLWQEYIGPIKNQMCHKCDRKNCIQLSHLYDGTALENKQDWMERGRSMDFPCGHRREGNTMYHRTQGKYTEICRMCRLEKKRQYARSRR